MLSSRDLLYCSSIYCLHIRRPLYSWWSKFWISTRMQGVRCSRLRTIQSMVVSASPPEQPCTRVTSTTLSCQMPARPTSWWRCCQHWSTGNSTRSHSHSTVITGETLWRSLTWTWSWLSVSCRQRAYLKSCWLRLLASYCKVSTVAKAKNEYLFIN